MDESTLSPEEQKERKIMKLLLKIKNGTPPMRKASVMFYFCELSFSSYCEHCEKIKNFSKIVLWWSHWLMLPSLSL